MPTIIEQLETLDLAAIDDALGRVRVSLDVETGIDPSSLDVGAMLGDLAPVIDAVRDLDSDPDAVTRLVRLALAELGDLVSMPELEEVDRVVEGIGRLASLVTEVVAVLGADGPDLVDRLLGEVGQTLDLATLVDDVVGRAADGLGLDLPEPLVTAFEQLAVLGRGVDDPRELASLLLDSLAALDLGELEALGGQLEAAVEAVEGAGDTGALAVLLAEVDASVEVAIALAGRTGPDGAALDELVATVESLVARLDLLADHELPRVVDGIATDLRSARGRLVELDPGARLDALLAQLPRPGPDPLDMLVAPLRDLAGGLDTVTAGSVTAAVESARAELLALTTTGTLGDLLAGIDDVQDRLVRQVRALRLDELRDVVVAALRDVQAEVLRFDGLAFLDDLVAPIRDLVPLVEGLDTSVITDAVQSLADLISGVFDDFPIEDLRDAVDAVIDPLAAIMAEAEPLVRQVADELEGLVAQLDDIDFDAAGAEVLEALADIRGQVQDALSTDEVPDALKAVIAGVASVLKQMDLAVELSDPFDEAMAAIDIDALLDPVTDLWDELRDVLARATPEALVAELDGPFDELLDGLDDISLAPLTDALSGLFDELLAALRRADVRVLVAPLESEFQDLLASVRAVVDPAPLFAPLRDAYDLVHGALDAVDVQAIIDELLGGIADTPTQLTDAVGAELERRAEGGAPLPAATDDVFRFGDVLRPFAALVAEIRSRLHGLAGEVVGEALGTVVEVTQRVRRLLDPATAAATRIADGIDDRRGWFDPTVDGPLGRTLSRLAGLQSALDGLVLDASARARLDTAVGPVSLDARLALDVSVTAPAIDEATRTAAASSPPGMGRSIRLLARALDDLLPAPLLDATLDPRADVDAAIDAVIDAVDPAPAVAELDELGDRIQATLAGFVDELSVGLLTLWDQLFAGLQPLLPQSIAGRLQAVLDAVVAELEGLDPTPLEDEVRATVDAAIGLLVVHSPATVAAEVGAVVDAAIATVAELDPGELLGDLDPFGGLRAELEPLRPSTVLAPLVDRAEALTVALDVVLSIDLDVAGELVVDIEAAFSVVLDGVEREWEALLDELSGIAGGASATVGV